MEDHRIQLGTIHLDIASGPSATSTHPPWTAITIDIVRSLEFEETSKKSVAALSTLLNDGGISFRAESRRFGTGLIVRASISPSDAPGSTWRRQSSKVQKARAGALKVLYEALHTGWDEPGGWVMARTVRVHMQHGKPELMTAGGG